MRLQPHFLSKVARFASTPQVFHIDGIIQNFFCIMYYKKVLYYTKYRAKNIVLCKSGQNIKSLPDKSVLVLRKGTNIYVKRFFSLHQGNTYFFRGKRKSLFFVAILPYRRRFQKFKIEFRAPTQVFYLPIQIGSDFHEI